MPSTLNTAPALAGYQQQAPSPVLAPFVQCYWWLALNGPAPDLQFLHPDGGSGLIFHFAGALALAGQERGQGAIVSGPTLTSTAMAMGTQSRLMGVRFHPGMGYPFLRLPLAELAGTWGQELPQLALAELAERLAQAPSQAAQKALVEEVLLGCLAKADWTPGPAHQVLGAITKEKGRGPLAPLLAQANLSQRQLERQFKSWVGLSPKQFSRIQRVALARHRLKAGGDGVILDTAFEAGYFDQAHFTHDFKAVLGITPGQYLKKHQGGKG
ncbi:AraC family transcriptional regulator [Gallaecimonas xiamenensis]|uniref:AraC family transcriptional regulator n=1 Tax=Gallaecimonas xiamenensis 3-C-1 TaxID=745411 RepID=K2JIT4_9GAMM|nr:DUF6597 domain-containing transcriptional factor [Gallaecimonas xiamenensis]EKE75143.1 AraC family transcriptional regulator [Gallaecimonas xiamenensis 3-C-1]